MKKLLVYLSLFTSLIAQDVIEEKIGTEIINIIEKIIEKVEETTESIKKQYSVDLKEIENKYQEKEIELKKKLDEVINEKEQIKLEKDEVKTKFNIIMWFVGILGVVSIAGIIGVIIESIKMWKYIDKKVKERINLEVSEIVEAEKKKIEEIVKQHDIEEKLKRTKKICILSIDNDNRGDITKILKEFEEKDYIGIEEEINFNNYDLILINNNSHYDIEDINKILEDNPNTLFFYYGGTPTKRGLKNVNFSNSPFTLYSNLINTLRTQDLLNR